MSWHHLSEVKYFRSTTIFLFVLAGIFSAGFLYAEEIKQVELRVPFTSQSPDGDWRQPWQDACEEATIVMVDQYYRGRTGQIEKEYAKQSIRHIISLKEGLFGYSLDEPAQKIVDLINSYLHWEAHLVHSPSLEDLKDEIRDGRPVILPAYGPGLNNVFFEEDPDYHTVVLSGYDEAKKEFITQEPGTRHGLDFRYSYDTILSAMHDFRPNKNTRAGQRVAIFTRPHITALSANLDADHDGLTKQAELQHKSIPWLADSDGDSYLDGQEVRAGYSPTKPATPGVDEGSLIKHRSSSAVYLIRFGEKLPIKSEQVFLDHGYDWKNVVVVDSPTLNRYPTGALIAE